MPIYQYVCQNCGNQFEKRQGFQEEPLSQCPSCYGTVHRVISPVGIIFKGSGFYITDSKTGNKNGVSKVKKNGHTPATPATAGEGGQVVAETSKSEATESVKAAS